MGYLKILTEQEYLNGLFSYPTICLIESSNMLKFPEPSGYSCLDTSDGLFQCADGDFYLKNN